MYHETRRWSVQPVSSAEELADKLLNHSWCGCCGFEWDGFLWLNDSTSSDAAQEYAVVRKLVDRSDEYRQVESITVSWCNQQQLLEHIRQIYHGEQASPVESSLVESGPVVFTRSATDFFRALGVEGGLSETVVHPCIETPTEHGRCDHCV